MQWGPLGCTDGAPGIADVSGDEHGVVNIALAHVAFDGSGCQGGAPLRGGSACDHEHILSEPVVAVGDVREAPCKTKHAGTGHNFQPTCHQSPATSSPGHLGCPRGERGGPSTASTGPDIRMRRKHRRFSVVVQPGPMRCSGAAQCEEHLARQEPAVLCKPNAYLQRGGNQTWWKAMRSQTGRTCLVLCSHSRRSTRC